MSVWYVGTLHFNFVNNSKLPAHIQRKEKDGIHRELQEAINRAATLVRTLLSPCTRWHAASRLFLQETRAAAAEKRTSEKESELDQMRETVGELRGQLKTATEARTAAEARLKRVQDCMTG